MAKYGDFELTLRLQQLALLSYDRLSADKYLITGVLPSCLLKFVAQGSMPLLAAALAPAASLEVCTSALSFGLLFSPS